MNEIKLAVHTEATVLQFLQAAAALEARLDGALSFIKGITFREYRLLSVIAEAGSRGCSRISVAGQVGLSASAVTRALKPLEKLGFIRTVRNERDARQSLAVITEGGLELLADAQGVVRDVLGGLPVNSLGRNKLTEFHNRLQEFSTRA